MIDTTNKENGDNEELDLSLSEDAIKEITGENPIVNNEEKNKEIEKEIENEEIDNEEKEIIEDEKDKEVDTENIVKAYATLLQKEGILDSIEGIKTFDDIVKKEREKGDKAIEEFISDLPPKLAEQLKAHSKGINIDEVDSTIDSVSYLESLSDKSIKEDVKTATKLYRELMKLEGEDSNYIEEMIQIALDSDTIGKQGVRAKSKLINVHRKELEVKEKEVVLRENEIKKAQSEWANTLNGVLEGDKEIWEMKLSPKDKKEVKSILYDTVETRSVNGQKIGITRLQKAIEEDPLTLVQIAIGLQKGMFGKEGKLTTVKTKVKNETVKSLEDAIRGKVKTSDNSSVSNAGIADFSRSSKAIKDLFSGLKI